MPYTRATGHLLFLLDSLTAVVEVVTLALLAVEVVEGELEDVPGVCATHTQLLRALLKLYVLKLTSFSAIG